MRRVPKGSRTVKKDFALVSSQAPLTCSTSRGRSDGDGDGGLGGHFLVVRRLLGELHREGSDVEGSRYFSRHRTFRRRWTRFETFKARRTRRTRRDEEGWYGESLNEAAAVAAEQQQERQQEEAAARLAEADQEAAEREARTLTAKEEMALRKLIRTKTNQLEAQLCNDVSEDSPLAVALLDQITEAKEQLQGAGVKLTSPPPKKKRNRE